MSKEFKIFDPGGFVANVEPTDEAPLPLPPRSICRCRNEKHSFDEIEGGEKGALADPQYADASFSDINIVRDGGAGLFGDARSEDVNEDTYHDLSPSELEARRKKLRQMLAAAMEQDPDDLREALTDLGTEGFEQDAHEDLRAIPGFPTKSPLSED